MRGVDGHALTSAFFLPLLLRQTAPREQWQKGTAFCHPDIRVCIFRLRMQRGTINAR
jgi:hypothetical protein